MLGAGKLAELTKDLGVKLSGHTALSFLEANVITHMSNYRKRWMSSGYNTPMGRWPKSNTSGTSVTTARPADRMLDDLLAESAAAYKRAWSAFQKCRSDLEKVRNRMQKARSFGRLPLDHFEHHWK